LRRVDLISPDLLAFVGLSFNTPITACAMARLSPPLSIVSTVNQPGRVYRDDDTEAMFRNGLVWRSSRLLPWRKRMCTD
jgi:hypothetical protein